MNTVKTVKFVNNLTCSGIFVKNNDHSFFKRNFINSVSVYKPKSSFVLDVYRVKKLNFFNLCQGSFVKKFEKLYSTSAAGSNVEGAPPLNKENAHSLVMRLTTDERNALMTVLQEFESEQMKAEYKGWFYIVSN